MSNTNEPRKRRAGAGRPPLPDNLKQKYQRIAIYPETYVRLKKRSIKENKNIADLINEQF